MAADVFTLQYITGKTTLGYRYYNADGSWNGARVTANITEVGTTGVYVATSISIPTDAVGAVWTDSGDSTFNVNEPIEVVQKVKLRDDAVSASAVASGALTSAKFASGAFDAVWSVATRTITGGTVGTITGLTIANVENMATRFLGMIEVDGLVYRYTANALEQAPSGGGGGATASDIVNYDFTDDVSPIKSIAAFARVLLNKKTQRVDGSDVYMDIYNDAEDTVLFSLPLVTESRATPVVGTGNAAV